MELIERIHFLSNADMLKPLRHMLRDILVVQNCDRDTIDSMVMAINEACMNIIQHAYGGDNEGEIIIEFIVDDKDIIVRIIDFANTVNVHLIKSRDLDDIRPGGLGVHLIKNTMDFVEYKEGPDGVGNLLELRKHQVLK